MLKGEEIWSLIVRWDPDAHRNEKKKEVCIALYKSVAELEARS